MVGRATSRMVSRRVCFDSKKAQAHTNETAIGLRCVNFLDRCLLLVTDSPDLPPKISRQSSQYSDTIVFITVSRLPVTYNLKQNITNGWY
jgi:hypothetical protein